MKSATRVYVSVIVKNEAEQILVLQRSATTQFAPGQWEFVNGSIQAEEIAEEAALREVLEKTGLAITITELQPYSPYESYDAYGRWIAIPYVVTVHSPRVVLSEGHQTYHWVSEAELANMPVVGDDYAAVIHRKARD